MTHTNVSRRRLWFGALAGASGWAVHSLICTTIASKACLDSESGWNGMTFLEIRMLLGILTVLFASVVAGAGLVSYQNWKTMSPLARGTRSAPPDRKAFMGIAGMCISAATLIGVLWAGLPPVLIDLCVFTR